MRKWRQERLMRLLGWGQTAATEELCPCSSSTAAQFGPATVQAVRIPETEALAVIDPYISLARIGTWRRPHSSGRAAGRRCQLEAR